MLTPISAGIARMISIPSAVCPKCHREVGRLTDEGKCWGCTEKDLEEAIRQDASQRILGRLQEEVDRRLEKMGLSSEEIAAERAKVPADVRSAIAIAGKQASLDLIDGELPRVGFGLFGGTGTGKSFGLAALLKVFAESALRRRAPLEGEVPLELGVCWSNWPAEAEWFKVNVLEAGPSYRRLQYLIDVPLLVLDDVGAERMKGTYEEDYAAGKLDLIVDGRSRDHRPIIWTSNLDKVALARRYGSRMSSRLLGQNPGAVVTGPDLRLKKS